MSGCESLSSTTSLPQTGRSAAPRFGAGREQPQPLVSYHLRQLQAEQLVEGRRSAFDGRQSEVLLGQLAGGLVEAVSAGSHPKPLHANMLRVLRERGIDPPGRGSRHLSEFAGGASIT
jgi:hypothetical protein